MFHRARIYGTPIYGHIQQSFFRTCKNHNISGLTKHGIFGASGLRRRRLVVSDWFDIPTEGQDIAYRRLRSRSLLKVIATRNG